MTGQERIQELESRCFLELLDAFFLAVGCDDYKEKLWQAMLKAQDIYLAGLDELEGGEDG